MTDDISPASRKRGLFQDSGDSPVVKTARRMHPEYLAAFEAFDGDRSGFLDIGELHNALQRVQQSSQGLMFQRAFNASTCCWLCARFGDNARLTQVQFCDLLGYLQ